MIHTQGIPGRVASVDGKEFLFFSGFAYLGMPSLEAFRDLVREGAETHGVVFPSSRISNTRASIYEVFEERLSAYTGLPASASFSSGYMASQAAVFFASQNSELLYSPGIHPSLKIAGKPDLSTSPQNWQQEVTARVNHEARPYITIVMESVNPLTGTIHDFSWMKEIRRPVRLLIDDSHGIGILGARGEGIMALLPKLNNIHPLICYSLSKAFSCEGGAVSGAEDDIAGIKKSPWFTAATGMSPAFIHAWMEGQNLFTKQREKLSDNIASLIKLVSGIPSMQQDPRLPVCYIKDPALYEHCLKYRILLSAFRYPSERDPLMARVVLNALHTAEDLERLNECVRGFYSPGK